MIFKLLYKKILPSKELYDSYSLREQEQLSILIGSNLVFMILFALFGISLFFLKYFMLGAGGLFLLLFFSTSLRFIKKGHIHRASWTTTIAICILTAIVCFFSPFQPTNFLPYRDSCFIVVMAVCNYVISLRRKQLQSFFIFVFIVWIIANFTIYKTLYNINFADALVNIIICSLGVITANICLLFFDRFTRRVVDRASENEKKSTDAFKKITSVLNETKEGLNIGKHLSESTNNATKSVNEIDKMYSFINKEATNLNKETITIKSSSSQINENATQMRQSVQNQSKSISQSSAALTQMSANLSNISKIAIQQRTGMNTLVENLDLQMNQLEKLVDNVEQVKESSEKVSAFVAAVNKIASQTGLLAMNASIEAAHAGVLGEGFSVIAHEIRKLSDETSKYAQKIAETLQTNEEIVKITSDSVTSFSNYTKASTSEIRNTIGVMEEILSGISEIDSGAQDVSNSIAQIVEEADTNTNLAEGVTNQIIQQNDAIKKISDGTELLQAKVSNLDNLLTDIKNAIDEIEKNAEANEIVSEKILGALE